MPEETEKAVEWAKKNQKDDTFSEDYKTITELVRQYFNDNDIEYNSFRKSDLETYM